MGCQLTLWGPKKRTFLLDCHTSRFPGTLGLVLIGSSRWQVGNSQHLPPLLKKKQLKWWEWLSWQTVQIKFITFCSRSVGRAAGPLQLFPGRKWEMKYTASELTFLLLKSALIFIYTFVPVRNVEMLRTDFLSYCYQLYCFIQSNAVSSLKQQVQWLISGHPTSGTRCILTA